MPEPGRLHQAAGLSVAAQPHNPLHGKHRCRHQVAPFDIRLEQAAEPEGGQSKVLQRGVFVVCGRSKERERSPLAACRT